MKNIKVLAIAIAAMAFAVACNNAPEEPVINQDSIDSVAAAEAAAAQAAADSAALADSLAAAEAAVAENTPAPAAKATTPKQKTVKEVAKEEGEKVAKKAVTAGAEQAANAIDEGKTKKNPFKK